MTVDGQPIVDLVVYTKNRAFRLPGSSKYDPYKKLPVPTLEFLDQCIISTTLPSNVNYVPSLKAKKASKASKASKRGVKRAASGKPKKKPTAIERTEEHKALVALLRAHGDLDTEVVWTGALYMGVTHPTAGRKCLVGGEHNESDNCCLFVDDKGDVLYHCQTTARNTLTSRVRV
jgi:hypothetical protein